MNKDVFAFYKDVEILVEELTDNDYHELAGELNEALKSGEGMGSEIVGDIRTRIKNYHGPGIVQKELRKKIRDIYRFTGRYFKF